MGPNGSTTPVLVDDVDPPKSAHPCVVEMSPVFGHNDELCGVDGEFGGAMVGGRTDSDSGVNGDNAPPPMRPNRLSLAEVATVGAETGGGHWLATGGEQEPKAFHEESSSVSGATLDVDAGITLPFKALRSACVSDGANVFCGSDDGGLDGGGEDAKSIAVVSGEVGEGASVSQVLATVFSLVSTTGGGALLKSTSNDATQGLSLPESKAAKPEFWPFGGNVELL